MRRLAVAVVLLLVSLLGAGEEKGTKVTIDDLTSVAPAAWKKEKPANRLRSHQFLVPRAEGDTLDAELAINPNLNENPDKSLERWKSLFLPPPGQDEPPAKVERFKVGKIKVIYLDVSGTYNQLARPELPKSKGVLRPNFRMLVLVFETPDNSHKISLVGPAKTIAQHKSAFDSWIKGFK